MSKLSDFVSGGVRQVLSGEITLSAGATSAVVNIPAVNSARAVLCLVGRGTTAINNASPVYTMGTVALTSATTITAQRGGIDNATTLVLRWVLVEFASVKQVINGEIALNGSTLTASAAIPAVNTAKAAVFPRGTRVPSGAVDSVLAEGRPYLSNATTVSATKASNATNCVTAYTIVEF